MNKQRYMNILYDPNKGKRFEADLSQDAPVVGARGGAQGEAEYANDAGFVRPRADNKPTLYAQEHLEEEREHAHFVHVHAPYVHAVRHGVGVSYFFIPPAAALMLGWEPKIYLGDDDGSGTGVAGIEGQGMALGARLDKELRDYLEKGVTPDERQGRDEALRGQNAQDGVLLGAGVYGVGVQNGVQTGAHGLGGHENGGVVQYDNAGANHSFDMSDEIIKGFREGAEMAHHAQDELSVVLEVGGAHKHWDERAEAVMKEFDDAVQEGGSMRGLGGIVPDKGQERGYVSGHVRGHVHDQVHDHVGRYGQEGGKGAVGPEAKPHDAPKVVPAPE